jgi:DNA-binding transcriptional LysR family regulator
VCGPSHPLAKDRAVDTTALTKHAYIGREAGSGTRAVVDRYLQTVGVPADSLQLVVELGSPEAIKGLIATGFGFSIMSSAIVSKELELGRLVQIPLNPPLRRNFSMVYPRERFHPKLVGSFVQFACERLRALTPRSAQ